MKKSIISVVAILLGGALGAGRTFYHMEKRLNRQKDLNEKHFQLYRLMNKWVYVKQEGKCLSEYFERKNYQNIAIYGMNYVGETLVNELKDTNINIVYAIDQNASNIDMNLKIVTLKEELEQVDVIVVTPLMDYDSIEESLKAKVSCAIVSIEDVIYEC